MGRGVGCQRREPTIKWQAEERRGEKPGRCQGRCSIKAEGRRTRIMILDRLIAAALRGGRGCLVSPRKSIRARSRLGATFAKEQKHLNRKVMEYGFFAIKGIKIPVIEVTFVEFSSRRRREEAGKRTERRMGKCRARLVFPSVVLFAEGVIKPSSPSSSSSSSHSSFFSSVLHASSFLFPWQRRHTRTEEERGKNWQEFDSLDKRERRGTRKGCRRRRRRPRLFLSLSVF